MEKKYTGLKVTLIASLFTGAAALVTSNYVSRSDDPYGLEKPCSKIGESIPGSYSSSGEPTSRPDNHYKKPEQPAEDEKDKVEKDRESARSLIFGPGINLDNIGDIEFDEDSSLIKALKENPDF